MIGRRSRANQGPRFLTFEEGGKQTQPAWRFIRVNSLTPRQKLRYFYLSTIQRAEQRGHGRGDSETPLEYSDDLKDGWPQAGRDIDMVTAGFLKSRYSEREITAEDAAEVQTHWKRLRTELKRRAETRDEEPSSDEGQASDE